MKLQLIKQQDLAPMLGEKRAGQACLPVCFYILGRGYGYFDMVTVEDYINGLDWEKSFNEKLGWLRPKLTNEIRNKYGVKVVSWQLLQKAVPSFLNKRRMKRAGYYSSAQEWKYFKKNVAGRSIFEIVRKGTPVIITVLPEFGTNKDTHSIILSHYESGKIKIFDPNATNGKDLYTEQEINTAMSPLGGGSIILPR